MSVEDNKKDRDNFISIINKLKVDKKVISKLENTIYDYCKSYAINNETPFLFSDIYTTKTSEIISHLNKPDSYLLNALKKNLININDIPKMTPDELNPEQFLHIKKKAFIEESKRNSKEGSTTFVCPKCKHANSRLIERQMRSGDEPPTIFIECLECNHKRKL